MPRAKAGKRLVEDIAGQLGDAYGAGRLIPYVQLHEFEALLFSDPDKFAEAFPDDPGIAESVRAIREQFGSPEDIDGADSNPASRLTEIAPDYRKTIAGPLIAKATGLAVMRRECPHFNAWIEKILAAAGP